MTSIQEYPQFNDAVINLNGRIIKYIVAHDIPEDYFNKKMKIGDLIPNRESSYIIDPVITMIKKSYGKKVIVEGTNTIMKKMNIQQLETLEDYRKVNAHLDAQARAEKAATIHDLAR